MMQIVSCALALLAGVVGAGFASGREVSRFFAGHGKAAPAAVLLASGSLLFFFLRLCEKMERLGAKDAVSLCRARFGKQLGTLCAGLFFLLSAVTAGAMLAACAELCALVLPLRHAYGIGMGAALFLSLLLTLKKTRGLAAAGAALCALLPVLLMRLYCIHGGEACFYPAMAPDLPVRALADGVSYAALNAALLLGTAPMLLSLQKPMRTRAVLLFSLCFSLLLCLACAVCIHCCLHEVGDSHTRNLHRILERKEDTCPCSFLRRHCQKVLSKELYAACSHSELRLSGKHGGKRTLTCTVRSHHSMNLTLADGQVNTLQDLLILNRSPQAFNLQ